MAKKFEPSPELLEQILTRYNETKNYSQVSRETGLSTAIIKRIIQESGEENAAQPDNVDPPKPKTTAQILAYHKQYKYVGLPPNETVIPEKMLFYAHLAIFKEEFLNV